MSVGMSLALKFWANLANRGVKDVLIVCCDGLTGLTEATWSKATVRTCVVHLIRASMRSVNHVDHKRSRPCSNRPTPRPTLTPPGWRSRRSATRPGAEVSTRGRDLPGRLGTVHLFLAFPPGLRRVIYTTNSIESLNYQLRRIIKDRGHFPPSLAPTSGNRPTNGTRLVLRPAVVHRVNDCSGSVPDCERPEQAPGPLAQGC